MSEANKTVDLSTLPSASLLTMEAQSQAVLPVLTGSAIRLSIKLHEITHTRSTVLVMLQVI